MLEHFIAAKLKPSPQPTNYFKHSNLAYKTNHCTETKSPPQTEILHQHNRFSTFNNTSDRCPITSISKCRFDYTSVPFSSMITVHCSHHTPPQTAISLSCTSHPRPSGLPLTSLTSCISEIKKQDKQQQLGTLIDYLS